MAQYNPAGGQTYSLQSSISSTQTTITLSSFLVPVSGDPFTMTLMDTTIAYGTIAPRTSQSEFISFTGITNNGDGSFTLTGVTRGLNKTAPFTEDTDFKLPHPGGSQFILSDAPQVFSRYSVIANDETMTGRKQFPTDGTASAAVVGATYAAPTQDNEVATKKYVDDTASFGAPDASTTVKGIGKVSVAPVSAIDPIFAGDNDPRIPTQAENDALAGTSGAPSNTNRYITNADTATSVVVGAVARRNTTGDVTVNTTPTASTDAASKAYVDAGTYRIFTNGDTTKNAADASVTQNIAHGLGRVPKKVSIRAMSDAATGGLGQGAVALANTVYNGTTQASVSYYPNSATPTYATANAFTLNAGGNNGTQTGVITFDTTNIIITWTKTNSPTGTFLLLWEAE